MNINKINSFSFGCTFCDVPGRTARQGIKELARIQKRERKAGYKFGSCPVPGKYMMQKIDMKTLISRQVKSFFAIFNK